MVEDSTVCTFVDIVTCELFNVTVTVNNSLVQSVICLKTDLLQIFPPLFKIILSVAENNVTWLLVQSVFVPPY